MDNLFGNGSFWFLLLIYFMPTIAALANRSSAWGMCLVVNLFLGWTLIGWFIACGLAYQPTKERLAHRKKVKQATDEFYLRAQEKHVS